MNGTWLDFEKPIVDLERRIEDARGLAQEGDAAAQEEVLRLEKRRSGSARRSTRS